MPTFARIRVATACAVAGLGLLTAVPAASAHATLEQTSPAAAAVVAVAPEQVTLRFDEPVETALGSVRVFDRRLRRIDAGTVRHAGGGAIAVPLRGSVPAGTYTVAWRVVSADGHPVVT